MILRAYAGDRRGRRGRAWDGRYLAGEEGRDGIETKDSEEDDGGVVGVNSGQKRRQSIPVGEGRGRKRRGKE